MLNVHSVTLWRQQNLTPERAKADPVRLYSRGSVELPQLHARVAQQHAGKPHKISIPKIIEAVEIRLAGIVWHRYGQGSVVV
jgi:hypothetical protein